MHATAHANVVGPRAREGDPGHPPQDRQDRRWRGRAASHCRLAQGSPRHREVIYKREVKCFNYELIEATAKFKFFDWICEMVEHKQALRSGDILSAVQNLESVFMKAECDLSYVSRKLDTEFATVFAEQGEENVCCLK